MYGYRSRCTKGRHRKNYYAISLAAGLTRFHDKKVLLIDINSQAKNSKVLISNYQQLEQDQTSNRDYDRVYEFTLMN